MRRAYSIHTNMEEIRDEMNEMFDRIEKMEKATSERGTKTRINNLKKMAAQIEVSLKVLETNIKEEGVIYPEAEGIRADMDTAISMINREADFYGIDGIEVANEATSTEVITETDHIDWNTTMKLRIEKEKIDARWLGTPKPLRIRSTYYLLRNEEGKVIDSININDPSAEKTKNAWGIMIEASEATEAETATDETGGIQSVSLTKADRDKGRKNGLNRRKETAAIRKDKATALFADGMPVWKIAETLGVSRRTIGLDLKK